MNTKLFQAQDRFISYICSICDDFGFNRFVAQLYGVLYMSDKPLSLDDITERLGASKGNVSINIRELEKWGAARKVWIKGSRKDYYEAELDIKKIISSKLKTSMQRRLAGMSSMVDDVMDIVKDDPGNLSEEERAAAKFVAERMDRIQELKKLASTALSLAEKFL